MRWTRSDLSTISFIADHPKIHIVNNPKEIYKAAPKDKNKAETAMVEFVLRELPATSNAIVIIGFEDEANGEVVDLKRGVTPLLTAIQKIGVIQSFRENREAAVFTIQDAIMRGDIPQTLSTMRKLWKSDRGQSEVYRITTSTLRYLIQVSLVQDSKRHKKEDLEKLFPNDKQSNLLKAHAFTQKQLLERPCRYRLVDLIRAHERMLEVYRAMRPRPTDLYVPDAQIMTEQIILELMNAPRPRQRY